MRTSLTDLGMASVGADSAGRRGLCKELARLASSTDMKVVSPVPRGVELSCPGDAAVDTVLRFAEAPADPKSALCQFAAQPFGLFAPHMQPFALRSGAAPTAPYDLELKLESVLVNNLGGALEAMGFRTLAVGDSKAKVVYEIGVHELPLACPSGN